MLILPRSSNHDLNIFNFMSYFIILHLVSKCDVDMENGED